MAAHQRQRVDAQPAWVLHTYPFRETSLIVDVFTRDHGRVALLARGARRPRSALRGLLLAFQPLELGWAGKGEVQTLMKAEWVGGQPLLSGKALFCGYYLNELLINLLPREDAHESLFSAYGETLSRFAGSVREADLRRFEHALLAELGYGLTLSHDVKGDPITAEAYYAYQIEHGAVRLNGPGNSALAVRGKTLLDLNQEDYSDPRSLIEAKQLMRALMTHYLGGQTLATRKIFMELQEL
ncbi:MAG: DNA repair protein RecO [Zoogloeaceae bacterium]|nr:DNA repair protein RecO [Zoogloeaceae bacterium]